MNNDLKLPGITLEHGELHRIQDGKGLLLQCLSGHLWLTQDGDRRDYVLGGGDEMTIGRDGTSIVFALSDARFTVLSPSH